MVLISNIKSGIVFLNGKFDLFNKKYEKIIKEKMIEYIFLFIILPSL